ncbi:hypothetical protein RI367_005201 [Sorochytrium milnesiophthora]
MPFVTVLTPEFCSALGIGQAPPPPRIFHTRARPHPPALRAAPVLYPSPAPRESVDTARIPTAGLRAAPGLRRIPPRPPARNNTEDTARILRSRALSDASERPAGASHMLPFRWDVNLDGVVVPNVHPAVPPLLSRYLCEAAPPVPAAHGQRTMLMRKVTNTLHDKRTQAAASLKATIGQSGKL